ncbi:blue copper protein-like [Hevea brasiliensis]|uniref:blue copper protein-like n=1 Tax=Hevea brasiliensis TaxID=3981 RepID=UPI0025F85E37|nr:blue copper protein-like [Hevea brasiliensis]
MASNRFVAFAIAAIILPTVAMATEYIVGDDKGWNVTVNYTEWAQNKVFHVGDTLVFKYGPPHNVSKVDEGGFKECKPSGDLYNSGNDTFTLSKPGKKWYICGITAHCEKGQKLMINVEEPKVPAPAPKTVPAPAPNDSYRFISSWYQIFMAAVVVMAMAAI